MEIQLNQVWETKDGNLVLVIAGTNGYGFLWFDSLAGGLVVTDSNRNRLSHQTKMNPVDFFVKTAQCMYCRQSELLCLST